MARIESVHSFRGGTGKSNTTANLSAVVAARGLRVVLPDAPLDGLAATSASVELPAGSWRGARTGTRALVSRPRRRPIDGQPAVVRIQLLEAAHG